MGGTKEIHRFSLKLIDYLKIHICPPFFIMSGTYEQDPFASAEPNTDDLRPPMRLLARPPQFPQGKTATAITEMENMMLWFMNQGAVLKQTLHARASQYKRFVHLIFVNNNLIETEQWKDRMYKRGKDRLKIFSSKSDVSSAADLQILIQQGEPNLLDDEYTPIDFVLMCTHPARFRDICGGNGSILNRMRHFEPTIGFVLWFDEIDKFPKLLSENIPILQRLDNVLLMTGITATPYKKYWDLMHSIGCPEVDLLGQLPDPSQYRTLKDHNLQYTDKINIKSPAAHFKYLLEHPGDIMYENESTYRIPDLRQNTSSIYFVPGESAVRTHLQIAELAQEYGKNALVINGKMKGFFRAIDSVFLDIREYKLAKIKAKATFLNEKNEKVSFEDATSMDVAIAMYHDPDLYLQGSDLVITGFHCVERGVTFNRPNFQFAYTILSRYHYKEGSEEIESIIQIAGRCFGNKEWVPRGITILAPKYILDQIEQTIDGIIEFLRTNPSKIQHADVFRSTIGIPIAFTITDVSVIESIVKFGNLTKGKIPHLTKLLMDSYTNGTLQLTDQNHRDHLVEPFSFLHYIVSGKRCLMEEKQIANYRFPQFYEHHRDRKSYGQSVKSGEFQFDMTNIPLTLEDGTVLPRGSGFISFSFKPKETA